MDLPTRPTRKTLPHDRPSWVSEGAWIFITINCAQRGTNQLCLPEIGDAILASIAFNHERQAWFCRFALLMPDHLHAIIATPREPGLATTIGRWKHFIAAHHPIEWQPNFFDHRLRTAAELEEKSNYIAMNPVRRALCQKPEDWPWTFRPKQNASF
jgi:putative transposase